MESTHYVRTTVHQGIATIEFFHPKGNSLPSSMLRDLAAQIRQAGTDGETRVIVLRSGGTGAFCGGASFDEMKALRTEEEGLAYFSGFAHVINAMRTSPKLIVARVHGRVVGGGVGLVAAVDYALASEQADIRLSELSIGFGPYVIAPALERRMGLSAYSHLTIDSTVGRQAAWAHKKGLYAELHPDTEALDEAVRRLSEFLAHANPEAMAELKRIFWNGTEHWDTLLTERAAISARVALNGFLKYSAPRTR